MAVDSTAVIPEEDVQLRRIEKAWIKANRIASAAFKIHPNDKGGMSLYWGRYADEAFVLELISRTKDRKTGEYKIAKKWTVAKIMGYQFHGIDAFRELRYDPVKNDPEDEYEPNNEAHSLAIFKTGPDGLLSAMDQAEINSILGRLAFKNLEEDLKEE